MYLLQDKLQEEGNWTESKESYMQSNSEQRNRY